MHTERSMLRPITVFMSATLHHIVKRSRPNSFYLNIKKEMKCLYKSKSNGGGDGDADLTTK